jgi:predicted dehydrogenase
MSGGGGSDMKKLVNLGLIGCGRAAEYLYLPAFASLSRTRLVAVADPRPERCEAVTSRLRNCRAYPTAEQLLQENNLDGLLVLTPTESHIPLAIQSLRRGIPVLVEKPLASCTAGLEDLREVERQSDAFLMVGYNRRYWKPVLKLKQILRRAPVLQQFQVRMLMTSNVKAWQPICGAGDLLEDLGSHQLDLLTYLFEQGITSVRALEETSGTLRLQLSMGGSVRAHCLISHGMPSQEEVTVRWSRRSYRLHSGSERIQPSHGGIRSGLDLFDRFLRLARRRNSSLKTSYRTQLVRFADAIRGRRKPEAGLEEGAAVVEAIEAARRSLMTQKEVSL